MRCGCKGDARHLQRVMQCDWLCCGGCGGPRVGARWGTLGLEGCEGLCMTGQEMLEWLWSMYVKRKNRCGESVCACMCGSKGLATFVRCRMGDGYERGRAWRPSRVGCTGRNLSEGQQ